MAALSRFLNSPSCVQPKSVEVRSRTQEAGDPVELYLSGGALEAVRAGFGPARVSRSVALPLETRLAFAADDIPTWGMSEAARLRW